MAESLATEEEKELRRKQLKIRTRLTGFTELEYFKYPDGEDLLGKLRCTTKWAAVGSGLFGVLNALVWAKKPTYKEWTFLFLKPVVPAVGMAAIFTVTTYMATNIRKKDDEYNYALGGAAAGLILGAALRSIPHGVIASSGLGAGAMYYKLSKPPAIPKVHRINYSPFQQRILDLSFTPPKKGNWSKEKPVDQ